ncbi:MAG TPA: hypothetical protein VMT35_05470 [Ignavibacteriaceae bacterium]|nr:hypothetical protein [Ignavibacteriaceae bacterium]
MKNLIFTLLFSLMLLNAVQSQTQSSIDKLFNRNWNRTMPYATLTFIFRSDTTCNFINPANNISITVKFKLEGNVITFPAEGCPSEGRYKFSTVGNEMTFQTENDSCNDRKDAIEGTWTTTDEMAGSITSQTSSPKKIYMDIAHGQKFWNDPAEMKGQDANWINRVKYMTDQFLKTASSVNADLFYLKDEIKPKDLSECDLLFIHIPSSKYTFSEVKAIIDYLKNGGSLFLVMDEDYWSTLKDANVNDIIEPFDIQFGNQSPDTLLGGITKAGLITEKALKITYLGGRIINGGSPFCFSSAKEKYPFGVYKKLENGGKLIVMGDGMTSLYMTSWQGINGFQCSEFMHDVFKWLLK